VLKTPENRDYTKSVPMMERIQKINKLYDEGNMVVYWTARGTITGGNWFQVTLDTLQRAGAKFHELRMNKPYYDLFIDDKNINSEVFFTNVPGED
tara:strand:- start:2413 stop:2697 length:285 start_codon:yes stop_codon:yes gene_type:complete